MHRCLPIIIVLALCSGAALAQDKPLLTITSPVNGTVVKPGETLPIVLSTSGVTNVTVVGDKSLGPAVAGNDNLHWNLTVPNNINPGRYYLAAVGNDAGGRLVSAFRVSVIVSLSSHSVSSIQNDARMLTLSAPGEQVWIAVNGNASTSPVRMFYKDLAFSSSNPAVASIDNTGKVTAQSAGMTTITTHYGSLTSMTKVTVGGAMRGDLNNDGQVDKDDLALLTSALNTPANGPHDARDLNHDGRIDAKDVEIEKSLCTHPNCAYQ